MSEIFVSVSAEPAEVLKRPQVGVQLALVMVLNDGDAVDGREGVEEFRARFVTRAVLAHGLVEETCFDDPKAADTPLGDGDVSDRAVFERVAGAEAVELLL